MAHISGKRNWGKIEEYCVYWTGYLLLFTMIEGLTEHDFFMVFRNELFSLIPKSLFVYLVVEILLQDLFARRFRHFIMSYLFLVVGFAFCLRLIDNYIILKYYLIHWKTEPLLSSAPFLYNVIKLQFLLTIPFCLKLYRSFNMERRQAQELRTAIDTAAKNPPGTAVNDKAFLSLTCEHRNVKILFNDIFYFEAQGNYLLTYTNKGVFKTYQAISKLEKALPQSTFARIHRSFIVALDKVDSHTSNLIMIGDKRIPIGRSYIEKAKISLASNRG